MLSLAHKIELKPNNKQRTYFKKACGVSRFTWNWALSSWDKAYEENKNLPKEERFPVNGMALKKQFNKLKKEQFDSNGIYHNWGKKEPILYTYFFMCRINTGVDAGNCQET